MFWSRIPIVYESIWETKLEMQTIQYCPWVFWKPNLRWSVLDIQKTRTRYSSFSQRRVSIGSPRNLCRIGKIGTEPFLVYPHHFLNMNLLSGLHIPNYNTYELGKIFSKYIHPSAAKLHKLPTRSESLWQLYTVVLRSSLTMTPKYSESIKSGETISFIV